MSAPTVAVDFETLAQQLRAEGDSWQRISFKLQTAGCDPEEARHIAIASKPKTKFEKAPFPYPEGLPEERIERAEWVIDIPELPGVDQHPRLMVIKTGKGNVPGQIIPPDQEWRPSKDGTGFRFLIRWKLRIGGKRSWVSIKQVGVWRKKALTAQKKARRQNAKAQKQSTGLAGE